MKPLRCHKQLWYPSYAARSSHMSIKTTQWNAIPTNPSPFPPSSCLVAQSRVWSSHPQAITPHSPLNIGEHLPQEVPGEALGLLVRRLEPVVAAVVRVVDDLDLPRARVLPEQHDLGPGAAGAAGFPPLLAQDVAQVRLVHGEDVVEVVEV